MATGGYASVGQAIPRLRPRVGLANTRVSPVQRLEKSMRKLTLKQRLRNWLMDTDDEGISYAKHDVEVDSISSNGMRFNLYKASGGYVIETRIYDEKNDRNINKLHVITEEQDLGDAIGKIITMESLR